MRRCILLVGLGLLLWAEPVSAAQKKAKVYELTVSQQAEVQPALTKNDVKSILKRASDNLVSHGCNVRFTLKGEIGTFTSAPATIESESDLEAAHSVPADVKIVQHIHFCVGKHDPVNGYFGCSWRPEDRTKTVIVSRLAGSIDRRPIVWAHEFGHTTGLLHRLGTRGRGLMTPCGIQGYNKQLTKAQCDCFLGGPGSCHVPQSENQKCPKKSAGD